MQLAEYQTVKAVMAAVAVRQRRMQSRTQAVAVDGKVVAALVLLFFATKARHKEQAARSLKTVSGTSTHLLLQAISLLLFRVAVVRQLYQSTSLASAAVQVLSQVTSTQGMLEVVQVRL
jgi:protein-S-isoprenylcysteine O-methyltransferase Ste14